MHTECLISSEDIKKLIDRSDVRPGLDMDNNPRLIFGNKPDRVREVTWYEFTKTMEKLDITLLYENDGRNKLHSRKHRFIKVYNTQQH